VKGLAKYVKIRYYLVSRMLQEDVVVGCCAVRGVRGAVSIANNTKQDIVLNTRQLLVKMVEANQIQKEDIAGIFFTMTPDLNAVFPAEAARELGWTEVPLICSVEIAVPDSLKRCVRVMMYINTEASQKEVKHIYLGEARSLRADLLTDNT
jgi:chorismate mutase